MAEFSAAAPDFAATGYGIAALSVDSPLRSAALKSRLALPFPLLCDPARHVVRAWNLYNPGERGGIARPATIVLDANSRVLFWRAEAMAARIRPVELLDHLRSQAPAPTPRRFLPGWRSFWRSLRA